VATLARRELEFAAAIASLVDDLEESLAHLKLPIPHQGRESITER